jgi:hypothetical protein
MKRSLALTLLAVLVACAPAAAAAKPPKKLVRWTYAVTVKGDATYAYASAQPAVGGTFSTTDDLTFRFKAKMPKFQILAGRVLNSGIAKAKLTAVDAKRHQSMPDPLSGVATGDCAGTTATSGTATLSEGLLAPLGEQKDASLVLVPFSQVSAPFTCVGELNGPGSIVLADTTSKGDNFDIDFDLPDEAIGMGKVIQLFNQKAHSCPAASQEFKTKCEFRMKGTITLRRVGKKVLGKLPR